MGEIFGVSRLGNTCCGVNMGRAVKRSLSIGALLCRLACKSCFCTVLIDLLRSGAEARRGELIVSDVGDRSSD